MQQDFREKTFEAGLYVPKGFVREIVPVTNSDLQHLSVQVMNKTSSKALTKGNTEVHAGMTHKDTISSELALSHRFKKTSFLWKYMSHKKKKSPVPLQKTTFITRKRSTGFSYRSVTTCTLKLLAS